MVQPSSTTVQRRQTHFQSQFSQVFSQRDEISAGPQRQMGFQQAVRSRKFISGQQNMSIERQESPNQSKSIKRLLMNVRFMTGRVA